MKKVILQTIVLVWTSTLCSAPLISSFTYQGRLLQGSTPASGDYGMIFYLYDAPTNGTSLANVILPSVPVSNGVFTVLLSFGPEAFDGSARWLEITIQTNGGPFTVLTPRQPITATPYALHALSAAGLMTFANAPVDLKVNGRIALRLAPGPENSLNIIGGSRHEISPFSQHSIIAGGDYNRLEGGNYVTISGGSVITVESNASYVVVGGGVSHNIAPQAHYSVIAGGEDNRLGFGAEHGSIGGGGYNAVDGRFGAIGGGGFNTIDANSEFNTIAGGYFGRIGTNASYSVIGGGNNNLILDNARQSTIAGGQGNRVGLNAADATISGGANNFILENSLFNTIAGGVSGSISTNSHYNAIGGGYLNRITENAQFATVPGGRGNEATNYALAAGRLAKAKHTGSFVWADATEADFSSTSTNQFAVRARGGVRFETAGAGITLNGQPVLIGTIMSTQLADGAVTSTKLSDGAALAEILDDDGLGSGLDADMLDGLHASAFWQLGGNGGTIPGTHFVGTTDNRPLDLRVNNQRALRLEPTASNDTVNVIGGSVRNFVAAGVVGATIGGGGASSIFLGLYTNSVAGDFGTIAGGLANRIHTAASFSAIAGGENNAIGANSSWSSILGGLRNAIGTNAQHSVIAGGWGNNTAANSSTISGGQSSRIGTNSWFAVIGGGSENLIAPNSSYPTIAGGQRNEIGTNSDASTVGGGSVNRIASDSEASTIGGGVGNDIGTNSAFSAIGGGTNNNIAANSPFSTIAGGQLNDIGTNSHSSTVGGGTNNNIGADSPFSTIAGGSRNNIGTNSSYCTIGGGLNNNIAANSRYATIPGGAANFATNQAFAAGSFASAIHAGAFVWGDTNAIPALGTSTNANSVTMRALGGYRFITGAGGGGAFLAPGGGSWMAMSDRNAKENFKPVDSRAVLDKVAALPLSTWNYKSQTNGVRHIGPMAQDFKAAFEVGETDTGITTIDADGVALAAIQGLNQKLQQELSRRDAENAELKRRLEAVEKMLHERTTD